MLARMPTSAKIEAIKVAKKEADKNSNSIKKGCLKLVQAAFLYSAAVGVAFINSFTYPFKYFAQRTSLSFFHSGIVSNEPRLNIFHCSILPNKPRLNFFHRINYLSDSLYYNY
jgi:hypothetical protein